MPTFTAEERTLEELKKNVTAELAKENPIYYIARYKPAQAPSKAVIWQKFGPVCDQRDSTAILFAETKAMKVRVVGCHSCSTVYGYVPARGTSTLNKHACPVGIVAAGSSHNIEEFVKPPCKPNEGQKIRMKNALADMCALDMRPFHMVANPGFLAALQTSYDIGMATKKPMLIDDLVCVPKTVKQVTIKRYEKLVAEVKKAMNKHVKDKIGIGATTDIWTDGINNVSFMSVTLHHIDEDFILHARTISCDQFPVNTRHTAPEILFEFVTRITPFISIGVDEFAADDLVIVTTDSASNNVGADGIPSRFQHEPCKCHNIGTCISYVLDKRTQYVNGKKCKPFYEFLDAAPDVFAMIDACKDLVTHAKHTGLNKLLHPRMVQHNVARWDGLLAMCNSIYCERENHREVFVKAKKEHKFDLVDMVLLEELVRFLYQFKLASKALEAFNSPTIHLVAFWRQRLIEHCAPVTESFEIPSETPGEEPQHFDPDSDEIVAIKELILLQIMEKLEVTEFHAAAAYLQPSFKHRLGKLGIGDDLIDDGMAFLKTKMQAVGDAVVVDPKRKQAPAQRRGRPKKRASIPSRRSALSEIMDSSSDGDGAGSDEDEEALALATLNIRIDRELLDYGSYKLDKADKTMLKSCGHKSGALLGWWKSKAKTWPILARAARSLLSVPASSAKSENNFSDAGNTITAKRNSLKPATLNMLMFLRSNLVGNK